MTSCLLSWKEYFLGLGLLLKEKKSGWLVGFGFNGLRDNISVYIGPSPKEREKEEKR